MASEAVEKVTVAELESKYEMEGNVPPDAGTGYGGDTKPGTPYEGKAPASALPAKSEPAKGEGTAERETRELGILADLDDNVALLEQEETFAKERAAAPKPPAKPAGEGEEHEEGDEPAPEPAKPAAKAPEAPKGDEADPVRKWLDGIEPESRQDLLDVLLEDDSVKVRFRANDEDVELAPREVVRRAQGYAGGEKLRKDAADVARARREIEQERAELAQAKQLLDGLRTELVGNIDDPKKFTKYLTQSADLEYAKRLRDELDGVIQQAESNPEVFELRREVADLNRMLRGSITNGAGGTPKTPSGTPRTEPAANSVPEDFGFQPGVGYPEAHLGAAWAALKLTLKNTGVSPEEAAKAWSQEGYRRPVFDVAEALVASRKENLRKAHLSEAPPARTRSTTTRVTGKQVSKAAEPAREREVAWGDIPDKLVEDLRAAQEAGEL